MKTHKIQTDTCELCNYNYLKSPQNFPPPLARN